jgi:hypothetical protein
MLGINGLALSQGFIALPSAPQASCGVKRPCTSGPCGLGQPGSVDSSLSVRLTCLLAGHAVRLPVLWYNRHVILTIIFGKKEHANFNGCALT